MAGPVPTKYRDASHPAGGLHAHTLTLDPNGDWAEGLCMPPLANDPCCAPSAMAVTSAVSASVNRYEMSGQPPGPGRAVRPESPPPPDSAVAGGVISAGLVSASRDI